MGTHDNRIAIVTGAGRGIGRAIAVKMAERGATLVLVDRDAPTETASMIGGSASAITADVSQNADWERVAAQVDARFGRADIVVNNAGVANRASIDELDEGHWRTTLGVNLDAHFYSAKHFVPLMRRNGWGRFVNISSASIGSNWTGMSDYMASKMGVIGFVRGLANDVAADGITVNAILPALTDTAITKDMPEDTKIGAWKQQAIQRFAQPDDIAGPVVFLCSDDAAFITGQALVVDGGMYKIS